MGNAAWGHGYHQGHAAGAKHGALVTAGLGVVVTAGVWAAGKLKQRRTSASASTPRASTTEEATQGQHGAGEPTEIV